MQVEPAVTRADGAQPATPGVEPLGVAELQPDVSLIDVNLGDEDGFEVARTIAAATEGTPARVILISTYAEEDLVDGAPGARKLPFLSKSELSGESLRKPLR